MAKIVITIQDRDDKSAEVSWVREGEGKITDLTGSADMVACAALGLLLEAKMEQELEDGQLSFDFSDVNLSDVDEVD